MNIPTILTEQYPKGLGSTITKVKQYVKQENIFKKQSFSALENNEIQHFLKINKYKNIVLCGIETHICVYQTALSLLENGYNIYLIKDICADRHKEDYNTSIELMRDFGIKITCLETVLFELLKTSKHPDFKAIQALIK